MKRFVCRLFFIRFERKKLAAKKTPPAFIIIDTRSLLLLAHCGLFMGLYASGIIATLLIVQFIFVLTVPSSLSSYLLKVYIPLPATALLSIN